MFSDYLTQYRKQIEGYLKICDTTFEASIKKAENSDPLSLQDIIPLILTRLPEKRKMVLEVSEKITRKNHGNKIGLIAPLYINNNCYNACSYCGMSRNNKTIERKKIENNEQFTNEVIWLKQFGYETIEMVAGSYKLDLQQINTYFDILDRMFQDVSFYFDTQSTDNYKIIFGNRRHLSMMHWQETYIEEEYEKYHPKNTLKGDFNSRLNTIECAINGGLRKYLIGILFGLADPVLDVLLCISHGQYLSSTYNIHPRGIGIVRLQPSAGAELVGMPYNVSEQEHLFYSAILRLAFPDAQMIVTSRESESHISNLLKYAATFTNATCTTIPGGYNDITKGIQKKGQFFHNSPTLNSVRNMAEKINLIIDPMKTL